MNNISVVLETLLSKLGFFHPSHAVDETFTTSVHMYNLNIGTAHLAPFPLCRIYPTNQLINSQKVRSVCSSAPMHHAANCISSNEKKRGMYMPVNMLYQTMQILVTFFYSLVQQITQKVLVVRFFIHFRYEALYFSCQDVIQYTTCTFVF